MCRTAIIMGIILAAMANHQAKADATTTACTSYVSASGAWQAAIEAASPGTKICMNPGNYSVSSPVRVPTGVAVFGAIASPPTHYPTSTPTYGAPAAAANVVVTASTDFAGGVFQTYWTGTNSAGKTSGNNINNYFSGMTIRSAPLRPFSSSNLTGIQLLNCRTCSVENIVFTHLSRFGIGVYKSGTYQTNNIYLAHNSFSDIGQDITPRSAIPSIWVSDVNALSGTSETGEISLVRNLVTGRDSTSTYTVNADGGIAFYNSRNISVWNNSLTNVGFYLAGQVQNGSGQWIDHGCHDAAFSGNVLTNTQEWGFDIVQGSDLVDIENNTVTNAGFGAVVLNNVRDVKVRSNTLSGNRWHYVGCGATTISGSSSTIGSLVSVTGNSVGASPQSCNSSGTSISTANLITSPNVFAIPAGQTRTATFTWNIPGYSSVGIWVSVDGGTPVNNTAGGTTGSASATWITGGHTYKFMAYPYGPTPTTLLAYDTVVTTVQ